jgi:hypothetical protein
MLMVQAEGDPLMSTEPTILLSNGALSTGVMVQRSIGKRNIPGVGSVLRKLDQRRA